MAKLADLRKSGAVFLVELPPSVFLGRDFVLSLADAEKLIVEGYTAETSPSKANTEFLYCYPTSSVRPMHSRTEIAVGDWVQITEMACPLDGCNHHVAAGRAFGVVKAIAANESEAESMMYEQGPFTETWLCGYI